MTKVYLVSVNSALEEVILAEGGGPDSIRRILEKRVFYTGKAVNTGLILSNILAAEGSGTVCELDAVSGEPEAAGYRSMERPGRHMEVFPVPGKTRRNQSFVFVGGKEYKENHKGYELSRELAEPLRAHLLGHAGKDDIVLLAGSLPSGLDPGWYREVIRDLKARGVRVFFDAGQDVLHVGIQSGPFYIKPNAEEIRDLIGEYDGEDISALAGKLRQISEEYGVEKVIVTLGPDGVIGFDRASGGCARARSAEEFPTETMTTGCGDSFTAGFIYGLLRGLPFAECLRHGVAFGGANIFAGFPGLVTPPVIAERLKAVRAENIS